MGQVEYFAISPQWPTFRAVIAFATSIGRDRRDGDDFPMIDFFFIFVLLELEQPTGKVVVVPASHDDEDSGIGALARQESCGEPLPNIEPIGRAFGLIAVLDRIVDDAEGKSHTHDATPNPSTSINSLSVHNFEHLVVAKIRLFTFGVNSPGMEFRVRE